MVYDFDYVYYFVDPDPGVEVFFVKEGVAEKRGIDFKVED